MEVDRLDSTIHNVSQSHCSQFSQYDEDYPTSPELFDSNSESEQDEKDPEPSPVKLSPRELIRRSDSLYHRKISKYLTGVPPPPKHTTCPLNCSEILLRIKQNEDYFYWSNNDDKVLTKNTEFLEPNENSNDSAYNENDNSNSSSVTMSQDEQFKDSATLLENNSVTSDTFTMSSASSTLDSNRSKEFAEKDLNDRTLLLYRSTDPDYVMHLGFEEAYKHKAFGIQ